MSIEQKDRIHAVASVVNAAGGSAFNFQRGFATTARTGAGVYTLGLDAALGGIDITESAIIVTPRAAARAYASVTVTDDFTFVVRTWTDVPGALDNCSFDVVVFARGA